MYNKDTSPIKKRSVLITLIRFASKKQLCLCCNSFFFDTSFLTCKFTQVVKFCTTHFTHFVKRNAIDKRRLKRENSFHTHVVRHFTHSKTFLFTVSCYLDNNTAILLYTLLVTFFNTVSNCYCITTFESGKFLYLIGSKCLLCNFN